MGKCNDEVSRDIRDRGVLVPPKTVIDDKSYDKWLYDQSIPPQIRPLINIIEEKIKCMISEELLLKNYPNFDFVNKTCKCTSDCDCSEECSCCPCDECEVDRRFFNCAEDCLIGKYCTKKPKQ